MNYISLGSTCSIAKQMQNHNVKCESLPFDWIKTKKFDSVIELLSNNFTKFLDNLEFVKNDDKFFVENINNAMSSIYYNKLYDIHFCHDFHNSNLEDQIKEVQEKYQRRICRLYNIIKSTNEIIFIRDDVFLNPNIINTNILIEFDNVIKKINPCAKYKLIWIINPKKKFDHKIINMIDNCELIINYEKPKQWWHDEINWETIFDR